MKLFKICCLIIGTQLAFVSCNKEENMSMDRELVKASTMVDYSNEIDFQTGVDVTSDNAVYSDRSPNTNIINSCPTITVNNTTPGVFPKIFTLDFGTGCINNGINRSGILTITVSNYVMNYGSTMTIERSNYYINGVKVEGTVVYENTTTNAAIPQWNRTITNGRITALDGTIYNHYGTRTVKQIAGVTTLALLDNIYEISSGNHTIVKPNGATLTLTVVTPLIKKYACGYISQGQLNLQGQVLDGVLDYGDNTCDNLATYTHSNGQVYNITL